MSNVKVTLELTPDEVKVIRRYCWLRTLKLVEDEIGELPGEVTDRQQVILDDLLDTKDHMERVRHKLVNAIVEASL